MLRGVSMAGTPLFLFIGIFVCLPCKIFGKYGVFKKNVYLCSRLNKMVLIYYKVEHVLGFNKKRRDFH